jgi:glycosyltransferase involved in cell wall biosynthesis
MSPRPRLLCVFYANPDNYPPTYNALALLAQHFDVQVVCRKTDRESRLWPAAIRLDRIGPSQTQDEAAAQPAAKKLEEFASFCWAVRRALSTFKPAVVLAYEAHALSALRVAGCRQPVVYQRHEVEEMDQTDRRSLGGWVHLHARRASQDVPLLVFPEAARASYYQRHVAVRGEVLVVPNFPLASSFPVPAIESLVELRKANPLVFYRGSLGPANGIREAVRAMAHVAPSRHLKLAGPASPTFQRELDAVVSELALRDRVTFDGFVPFDELNQRTQHAAVGLMLYQTVSTNWSNIASANNKLYEYAGCGVPAIVPDRQDFRRFLDGEEWIRFVDPTDPRAIGQTIEEMLSDWSSYTRMCLVARRRFEERFNYEVVFGPMLERILTLAG